MHLCIVCIPVYCLHLASRLRPSADVGIFAREGFPSAMAYRQTSDNKRAFPVPGLHPAGKGSRQRGSMDADRQPQPVISLPLTGAVHRDWYRSWHTLLPDAPDLHEDLGRFQTMDGTIVPRQIQQMRDTPRVRERPHFEGIGLQGSFFDRQIV